MTIVTIDAAKRGRVSAPLAAMSTEHLTLEGAEIADGTRIAVLSAECVCLGASSVMSGAADIPLTTTEAYDELDGRETGAEVPAFIAIGEPGELMALVPCLLRRNWLQDLVPPAESAPSYPQRAELELLLGEMRTAAGACSEAERNVQSMQSDVTDKVAAADGHARAAESAASDARFARTGAGNSATQAARSAQQARESAGNAMLSESNVSDYESAALAAAGRAGREADRANASASRAHDSETKAAASASAAYEDNLAARRAADRAALSEQAVTPFLADAVEIRMLAEDIHVNDAGWHKVDELFSTILGVPAASYPAALDIENEILGV